VCKIALVIFILFSSRVLRFTIFLSRRWLGCTLHSIVLMAVEFLRSKLYIVYLLTCFRFTIIVSEFPSNF